MLKPESYFHPLYDKITKNISSPKERKIYYTLFLKSKSLIILHFKKIGYYVSSSSVCVDTCVPTLTVSPTTVHRKLTVSACNCYISPSVNTQSTRPAVMVLPSLIAEQILSWSSSMAILLPALMTARDVGRAFPGFVRAELLKGS